MVELRTQVSLPVPVAELALQPDPARQVELFRKLEFKRFTREAEARLASLGPKPGRPVRGLILMKPRVENLYVHVPFCTHLCPYCDFPKERLAGNRMRDFLHGLQAEWAWAQQEFDILPRRVFFGGGTPTALSPSLLKELLEIAPWGQAEEWTVEANPDGFGLAKAAPVEGSRGNTTEFGRPSLPTPGSGLARAPA